MISRLVNIASGNTIKEIHSPIRWLFNHDSEVSHFEVKALNHGEGFLIAYLDNNTMFKMTWASYEVMMNMLLKSRAWHNHFSGIEVFKASLDPAIATIKHTIR